MLALVLSQTWELSSTVGLSCTSGWLIKCVGVKSASGAWGNKATASACGAVRRVDREKRLAGNQCHQLLMAGSQYCHSHIWGQVDSSGQCSVFWHPVQALLPCSKPEDLQREFRLLSRFRKDAILKWHSEVMTRNLFSKFRGEKKKKSQDETYYFKQALYNNGLGRHVFQGFVLFVNKTELSNI